MYVDVCFALLWFWDVYLFALLLFADHIYPRESREDKGIGPLTGRTATVNLRRAMQYCTVLYLPEKHGLPSCELSSFFFFCCNERTRTFVAPFLPFIVLFTRSRLLL